MTAAEVSDVEELYALDPTEFVAARNALAKRLKRDGRKEEAADVATRKRPTPAAWALNQVARSDPDVVAAALRAGARLREASEAAMEGDASDLRSASVGERAASGALVAAALQQLGGSAAARDRLVSTVHAASVDEEVGDRLQRGVLAADEVRAGLGFGAASGPMAPARPAKAANRPRRRLASLPGSPDEPDPPDERTAAEAEAARLERERISAAVAEEQRLLDELRDVATSAQAEAERRAEAAEAADATAAAAQRAAADAQRVADDARRAAAEARLAADDAARAAAEAATALEQPE